MDWPRARIILLGSFAVVNLILAFFLWGPGMQVWGAPQTNSPEHLREVKARLKEAGAELQADLPQASLQTPFLRVTRVAPPTINLGRLSGHSISLDAPSGQGVQGLPGVAVETHGRLLLQPTIREDGTAIYQTLATGLAAESLDLSDHERLIVQVQRMLRAMGLLPDGPWDEQVYVKQGGTTVVECTQMLGGTPLFAGQVVATVSSHGIESVEFFWLRLQGGRGELKAVIPASQALLHLTGELESANTLGPKKPLVFIGVRLGYYAERNEEAQSWDMVPAWRIDLENGTSYYVNGFTGITMRDHTWP